MSPRPRQTSDDEILAATARVMQRRSPTKLTLADVAKEAGAARPPISPASSSTSTAAPCSPGPSIDKVPSPPGSAATSKPSSRPTEPRGLALTPKAPTKKVLGETRQVCYAGFAFVALVSPLEV